MKSVLHYLLFSLKKPSSKDDVGKCTMFILWLLCPYPVF